jgi:hypothetical protein
VLVPLGNVAVETGHREVSNDPAHTEGQRLPLRVGSWIETKLRQVQSATVYAGDVYQDGYPAVIFENAAARVVVSPCAGARAFIFEDKRTGENLFTTIGGLRDAWQQTYPPSSRDYIAKYTHPIATGTFNRCYRAVGSGKNGETFTYAAPDAPFNGATFARSITIDSRRAAFAVRTHANFPGSPAQRAQQLTSFALPRDAALVSMANGYGIFEPSARRVVLVAWPREDVRMHQFDRHDSDALLTLTYAPGGSRLTLYGFTDAASLSQARAALRKFTNRTRTQSL